MARTQQLAVVITCLVAAVTYAGAVTSVALAGFVLPGVLVAAVIGSFLTARRMPGTALVAGGVLALGWSELANVSTGATNGPVARSTFVAAICTLAAVVVVRSSWPALFLVPVAGSVCGAFLLGAAGEVRIVSVAAAVSATLTPSLGRTGAARTGAGGVVFARRRRGGRSRASSSAPRSKAA
jgi:hypothetical protein